MRLCAVNTCGCRYSVTRTSVVVGFYSGDFPWKEKRRGTHYSQSETKQAKRSEKRRVPSENAKQPKPKEKGSLKEKQNRQSESIRGGTLEGKTGSRKWEGGGVEGTDG